jgi:5'-methylthioadenosine phosphorylase
VGEVDGLKVAFLPRHGRGHIYSPTTINYRANIDILKQVGVTDVISLSAVGSLKEELAPGMFVLVDQFIDRTYAREKSFFGTGCVGHVPFANPVSPLLQEAVAQALSGENIPFSRGGTYVVMEGPQFSTLAESQLYQSWGANVIGMTNMPEAKLAREAEMCYCTAAMVTDYDSWHSDHGEVDVAKVVVVMKANSGNARKLILRLAKNLPREHMPCPIGSDRALEHAIMTAPASRDPKLIAKLKTVAGRVL